MKQRRKDPKLKVTLTQLYATDLDYRTPYLKNKQHLGIGVGAFNPSTERADIGGSLRVPNQSGIHSKTLSQKRREWLREMRLLSL